MEDELIQKLTILGLSETEAKLYQIGLGHGNSVGVIELQKQTSLKRPTIYHALDTLMAKGLVAKVAAQNRQLYSFTPPSQLQRLAQSQVLESQRKYKLAIELEPLLNNLQIEAGSTVVSHYEGIEGIKAVVDIALYCKSATWDILAPRKNFFSEFDDRYSKYYLSTRKRHGITTRSLWERTDGEIGAFPSRPLSTEEQKKRNPRYLPQVMHGRFSSSMIIFDDKVAILSSLKDCAAILITSQEISDFFRTIFEGLWSVSDPYDKK